MTITLSPSVPFVVEARPALASTRPAAARVSWLGRVLSGLPALMLALDAAMKLAGAAAVAKASVKLGIPVHLGPGIGLLLAVCLALYLIPRTAALGAVLLTGYLVRLADLLAGLAPAESEVHGLAALIHLQASRAGARTDAAGEPVLLADQDRARWDAAAIARGLAALTRADALVAAPSSSRAALAPSPGAYHLQAAIAACHARAASIDATDGAAIAHHYAALAERTPSPVIELNRAMAISRADGPAAGLAILDTPAGEPALARYHFLPAARAELLERLGRLADAAAEFERAAALATNARQRDRLHARAAALAAR